MKKNPLIILVFLTQLFSTLRGQNHYEDSLNSELKKPSSDTTKLNILHQLANQTIGEKFSFYNDQLSALADKVSKSPDKKASLIGKKYNGYYVYNLGLLDLNKGLMEDALKRFQQSRKIFTEIDHKTGIAAALNGLGIYYENTGNLNEAISFYSLSVAMLDSTRDYKGEAIALKNLGQVYQDKGDLNKALDCFLKTLKMSESANYPDGIAAAYTSLGTMYVTQSEFEKALDYFKKSFDLNKSMNDKRGEAVALNNIGYVHYYQKKPELALECWQKSLKIQEEIGNRNGIAQALHNLGGIYKQLGKLSEAITSVKRSLAITEEIKDKSGMISALNLLSKISVEQKDYRSAKGYSDRSLKLATEVGSPNLISYTARHLFIINKKLGNYKEALEMHELEMRMRDSITNEENKKNILEKEIQYKYDKKVTADSVRTAEAKKVSDAEMARKDEQLKREATQRYALFGGLALVILFGIFIYTRFRKSQEQKQIIENQKKEVEHQKNEIQEKNKDITDSINYALRIQQAILPDVNLPAAFLQDAFILFRPKDIVSGDFYWYAEKNGRKIIAAVDCTGHGVPGAFMSMIGTTFLNEIVNEKGIIEPGLILGALRDRIKVALKQSGAEGESKDGMDISLLSFSQDMSFVEYAGANNSLIRFRKIADKTEMTEFNPDKRPIGYFRGQGLPFTNNKIEINKGDSLYIYTDGFADQFGGPKGKKFKYRQLHELIGSILHLPAKEQRLELEKEFIKWKGDLEQVDDVCVIGIKI